MRTHSDPTANQAVGKVDREWKQMTKLAEKIRENPWSDWAIRQSARFTGIYKSLLADPPEKGGP